MKTSDEMLSAFLDAALDDADMEQVRLRLITDDTLTDRLAALAMVDSLVLQHYEQINQQPLPDAVLRLLDNTVQPSANIIQFPWWRKAQQQLQQHAAAVACIALFAGYGLSQLTGTTDNVTAALSTNVMRVLNSAPSGVSAAAAPEVIITPRLSFFSQQGDFCRQYSQQANSDSSENIACRRDGQWQLATSLQTDTTISGGQYQTASADPAIDAVLDRMMAGPALNATEEQQQLTDNKF